MIHSWFGKIGKQTKQSAIVLMTAMVCLLSACGEYFGQEWPEEFDPDKLPSVTSIDGLNNTFHINKQRMSQSSAAAALRCELASPEETLERKNTCRLV